MKQEYKKPQINARLSLAVRLICSSGGNKTDSQTQDNGTPGLAKDALTGPEMENQECGSRVRYHF